MLCLFVSRRSLSCIDNQWGGDPKKNIDVIKKTKKLNLFVIILWGARYALRSMSNRYHGCDGEFLFLDVDITAQVRGRFAVPWCSLACWPQLLSFSNPRFILQQLGPPQYETNCNLVLPSAPKPIQEGRKEERKAGLLF